MAFCRISVFLAENGVINEANDDRDRPKLEKDVIEQPQIKVPIEPHDDRDDKGEEVQLDRPDQGNARGYSVQMNLEWELILIINW